MFGIRRHLAHRKIASRQAKEHTERLLGHTLTKTGNKVSNKEKKRLTKMRFKQIMQELKNSNE